MATTIKPHSRKTALRMLTAVVGLNAAIFVGLRLCAAFAPDFLTRAIAGLALCSGDIMSRPWTAATYMFTQYDDLHFILNMLWLAWFWLLLADNGIRARSLSVTYLAGGLCGAAVYAAIAPEGMLIGSSGAVMALVAASAVAIPGRKIDLPLVRPVNVGVIAGLILAVSLLSMNYGSVWSHAAHIAGIGAGALSGWFIRMKRRSNAAPQSLPAQLPAPILEKLRTSGFGSLSEAERITVIDSSLK